MYVLPEGYHENTQLYLLSSPFLFNSLSEDVLKKKANDLEWFCGFSEAESMFFISSTGALSFRIKLHWDDKGSLVYIKNGLGELVGRDVGVIVDSKNDHPSYFTVAKFKDIKEILIPIFSTYYFTTSKYLDFQDFKDAAEIKKACYLENLRPRKWNKEELEKIWILKSRMNSKRKCFNNNNLPKRSLTPYRLLGFVEGDGTFCLPNMNPYFGLSTYIWFSFWFIL